MSSDKLVDENDPSTWVAKTKVAPVKFTKWFLFVVYSIKDTDKKTADPSTHDYAVVNKKKKEEDKNAYATVDKSKKSKTVGSRHVLYAHYY